MVVVEQAEVVAAMVAAVLADKQVQVDLAAVVVQPVQVDQVEAPK